MSVISTDQWELYIKTLCETGLRIKSARQAEISWQILSARLADDAEFVELVELAELEYGEKLQAAAAKRGMDGVTRELQYSDPLLSMLLKKFIPAFQDKLRLDATIKGGVLAVNTPITDPKEWLEKYKD